jgi:phosphate transport system protein
LLLDILIEKSVVFSFLKSNLTFLYKIMTLKEHTVKSYDKDLKSIAGTLDDMMLMVIESINMVSELINSYKSGYLEKISKHDYNINNLDHLIERKVTAMLAMRQPMAVDLRYVVSSLKVASNLERIGDQAKSIIKKIDRIGEKTFEDDVKKSLLTMLEIAKIMVKDAVVAFNDQDIVKAEEVLKKDDQIDQIYSSLFGILEKENFSTEQVKNIINILFIAKNFERLADHSTNIAEMTKYVVSGETV